MPSPYIIVEAGAPRIVDELPNIRANRFGVIHRYWEKISAFDHDFEYQLNVADIPRFSLLSRLLATKVYNPKVVISACLNHFALGAKMERLESQLMTILMKSILKIRSRPERFQV